MHHTPHTYEYSPTSGNAAVIALPSVLDTAAADMLHTALLEALKEAPGAWVEGGAVERITTAPMQLLLSAAMSFRNESKTFFVRTASEAMRAAFDELGLSHELAALMREAT